MTITRILTGVLLAAATAGPVSAQAGLPPYSAPGRAGGVLPSVAPAGGADPAMPPASSLEKMTAPVAPGATADPAGTLAAAPGPNGLPPGSYPSPWYTDGPGCCGPLGRHGQVAYELHAETGPAIVFGSGFFTDRLKVGWTVAGGGRTLLFNPAGDAAWTIDLGLSYTYNRGSADDLLNLFIRQRPTTNQQTGAVVGQPDILTTSRIRGLHRTAFNFALGRDWFLWGPGNPGGESGWNVRAGAEVGGQWGTAHVDVVPNNAAGEYARRQSVFEGVFVGAHATCEVPVGGWIWATGLNVQYGYEWMNIVPPFKGDVQFVNVLLSTGFRF